MTRQSSIDLASPGRPFDNIINFRDVGRSVNEFCGKQVLNEGILFRSARLDEASERDKRRLADELHISTVIDLRSRTEHEMATRKRRSENEPNNSGEPSVPPTQSPVDAQEHLLLVPGCRRALISLTGKGFERALLWKLDWYNYVKALTLATTGYRESAIKLVGEQVMRPRGLTGLAQDTLEASTAELRSVFELLASEKTYPVLVHCTQGKDRTGLVVLLMLLLVGESVSPAAMADDYTRSESELVSEFDERIREIRALGLDEEYTRCPPGFVEAITQYLDQRYGGVRRYLTGIGIDADMQDRIRRKLIFGGI